MGFHQPVSVILPFAISLVSRPKLNRAPGYHFGVALMRPDGSIHILDNSRSSASALMTPIEFSRGYELTHHGWILDPARIHPAMIRLSMALGHRGPGSFDGLGWNCEHWARFVVEGESRSRQIRDVVAISAVAAACFCLSRSEE